MTRKEEPNLPENVEKLRTSRNIQVIPENHPELPHSVLFSPAQTPVLFPEN